jgi:hypothetical protein
MQALLTAFDRHTKHRPPPGPRPTPEVQQI